ncbi:hypothetical protein [Alkalicoccobacillus porphyridii]|uniref:Uncharacterized protein n=1 Tax=Alkalicoccobacillus porphyridii TaxID=2597270 RepID=A0A554A0C5_9BACI|nr:hypothetical protein [Alkalicoccobacillus porphyridii]TSB47135.1 hypothetical protein FN960_08985 [Alkalicoccobacillus porphyridii]
MNWLSEALAFVGGAGVAVTLVIKYIGGLAERQVQQKLDKGLEDHKANLESIKKEAEFDYQRKIHDFSMYSTKKHEVYHEVYKALLISKSVLFHHYKVKCESIYNDILTTSPIEIRADLEMNFSSIDIDNFEKENKGLGAEHLLIRRRIDNETQGYLEKIGTFNDIFRNNELFLSEDIADLIEKTNEKIISLGKDYYLQELNTESILREEINMLIFQIRDGMKEELSIGSYTNT